MQLAEVLCMWHSISILICTIERSDCGEKFLLKYEDVKSMTFVDTLDTKVFDRIPIIPRSPVAVFFGLVGMERGYVCKG